MTSRSFKPSSLSLRPRRPSIARTSSTSSVKSQDFASPLSASFTATGDPDPILQTRPSTPDTQRIPRSRPIAIELPSRKRSGQIYTPTPPEPLSARGDLLGGYFPLHEESQRSYKTHPFDQHISSTKSGSVTSQLMSESRSPLYTPHGHAMTDASKMTDNFRAPTAPDPIFMAMPLGKYYPSNYKNKTKTSDKLAPAAAAAAAVAGPVQHSRKRSDIKKKLQQYQRDMVEQAAMAGHIPFPGAKPVSPRLLPLGSPGPVTPMELEESSGYLATGAKGSAAYSFSHQELIGKMNRAAEEREGSATGLYHPVEE